jgi:hypothetical protein
MTVTLVCRAECSGSAGTPAAVHSLVHTAEYRSGRIGCPSSSRQTHPSRAWASPWRVACASRSWPKRGVDVGRQRQRAGAAPCLGPARRPPAAGRVGRHGPLDDQGAGRGVEVGPAEAQDFAAPEARERQQPARVQRVARGVLPQGRDVGRAERVPRLGLDARRLHLGRDVADDDPVVERLAEDRSHDEQRERARPLGLCPPRPGRPPGARRRPG